MSPVRFILALLTFLVASLVFLPAPNILLWQIKLGVTEYGAWFMFLPLVLLFLGRRRSVLDSVSVGLCVLSIIFFITPAMRASSFAATARAKMNATFPVNSAAPKATDFSFFRCWSRSKPVPVEVQEEVFTEYGGDSLSLDFYPAQGRSPAPCVLVLHTGGWENGTRREFIDFNNALARRGIAVASADYRVAPAAKWPAQHADAIAAISFLNSRADEFGIDKKKLVIMGRSAGGQIAQAVSADGKSGVAGCIGFYTPTDMKFAFQYADKKDILNSYRLLVNYLGGTPEEVPDNYDSATAYGRVGEKTPTMLLIHGAHDELVWCRQSERFDGNLRDENVKHVFLKLPWATHAFDHNLNGPGGQIALWAVERFVNSL
jgi:acetyl esterase/lipase